MRGPRLVRYSPFIWLSGLALPCLVIVAFALLDWLGIFIPAGSPWPVAAMLIAALAMMLTDVFISAFSFEAKLGLAAFTILLFPCCIVLFILLMAAMFGFAR